MLKPSITHLAPARASKPILLDYRVLGIIAILTAPAMTIEAARHGFAPLPNEQTDTIGAVLYGLFSLGWLASMLGLWQLRATGHSRFGRALAALTLVTISLAIAQSFMDIFKVSIQNPFYMVTDFAWPLSMLVTLAVGVAALVTGVLPGWKRFVPFFCGVSVPLALGFAAFGIELPVYLLDLHTITGWALLGYVVFSTRPVER